MEVSGTDNVKTEKTRAVQNYNRLQTIAKLFRLVEFTLALLFLSWLSLRLPFVFKISYEYFGKLIDVLINPLSIFLVGNCIIFTLLANSGHLSRKALAVNNPVEEYKLSPVQDNVYTAETCLQEEIVYQDKEVISEIDTATSSLKCDDIVNMADNLSSDDVKALRRSRSDNLKKEILASTKLLQRSKTVEGRKNGFSSEAMVVNKLSNKEFQRTIEEFIAKQVKFHKEEKLAIISL